MIDAKGNNFMEYDIKNKTDYYYLESWYCYMHIVDAGFFLCNNAI